MASVGNLVASLNLRAGQFINEMKNVSRSTARTQRSLQRFGRVAGTVFGALAGAGVAQFFGQIAQAAENLDLFSTRLGVNARQLQAWQLIAERSGVQANQFNLALQRVTRRAAEAAKGTGEARDALRALGIDASRFINLSLDDQMFLLADAFSRVENDAALTALAFKLFDSEGVNVLQFLKQGTVALREQRQELDGAIWSDEQREKLKRASQLMTEFKQEFTLLGGTIGAFLAQAGDAYTKWLQGLVERFETLAKLRRGLRGLVGLDPTAGETGAIPEPLSSPIRPLFESAPRPPPGISPSVSVAAESELGIEMAREALQQLEAESNAFNRRRLEQERALMEDIARSEIEGLRRMNEARETFTDLFTQNLVQAADGAFSSILKSWIRTLQQMVARAVASKLFNIFGGTSLGKSLLGLQSGGSFTVGGSAAADSNVVAFRATRGERVTVSPKGQGTGISINQTLNVQGASREEFISAAIGLKEQTKSEVFDQLRRAGRL